MKSMIAALSVIGAIVVSCTGNNAQTNNNNSGCKDQVIGTVALDPKTVLGATQLSISHGEGWDFVSTSDTSPTNTYMEVKYEGKPYRLEFKNSGQSGQTQTDIVIRLCEALPENMKADLNRAVESLGGTSKE